MPETWTVRRATRADLQALTMLSAANQMYHANVDASVRARGLDERRARYAALLDAENSLVLLGEAGDAPIACFAGIFYPSHGDAPARAYIEDAYVSRPWRRRGVLTAMVQALADVCRSRGIDRVDVDYLADNPAGAAAWARLGFEPRNVRATARLKPG